MNQADQKWQPELEKAVCDQCGAAGELVHKDTCGWGWQWLCPSCAAEVDAYADAVLDDAWDEI